jgi:hypothetical protein
MKLKSWILYVEIVDLWILYVEIVDSYSRNCEFVKMNLGIQDVEMSPPVFRRNITCVMKLKEFGERMANK